MKTRPKKKTALDPTSDPGSHRRSGHPFHRPTPVALGALLLAGSLMISSCSAAATRADAHPRKATGDPGGQNAWHDALRRHWEGEHRKLLDMARDLPASLYDSRPHPDSRSALDELRHVTVGLEMSTAQLEGREFDYQARIVADASKERSPDAVVAEMQAALGASLAAMDRVGADPSLIWWLSHQSEHYGKLVTIYRMNDRVPPVSRPRG